MSGFRNGLFGFAMLCTLLVCAGCGEHRAASSARVRQRLLQAMEPFQVSDYVEVSGERTGVGPEPESFVLVMGPQGRYVYRCGNTLLFSDGSRAGLVDFSTFPAQELIMEEPKEDDVAMSVAMAQGPYFLPAARVLPGEHWLSFVGLIETAEFTERKLADSKIEILVQDGDHQQRFEFSNPGMRLVAYEASRCVPPKEGAAIRFTFSIVRFPETVSDAAFRP